MPEIKTFIGFETAKSKAGKSYYKFFDDFNIQYTCFEEDIAKFIISNLNEALNVSIVESNGFKNIRGCNKAIPNANQQEIMTPKAEASAVKNPFELSEPHKMMLLSYAKDLFIAEKFESFHQAVDLLLAERARI